MQREQPERPSPPQTLNLNSNMWHRSPPAQNIQPVTRTYNTLMIACNTSSQWGEALRVYEEMAGAGHAPNTTTFNALISAYSKAGDLGKVLSIFKDMVQQVWWIKFVFC